MLELLLFVIILRQIVIVMKFGYQKSEHVMATRHLRKSRGNEN